MRATVYLGLVLALASCGKKRDPGAAEGSAAGKPGPAGPADDPAAPAPAADDVPAADPRSGDEVDKEAHEAAQKGDKVLAYIRDPMTAADVEETMKFVKAWRANEAYLRARSAWKEMHEVTGKKDDSTAGEMRKTRTITKAVGAVDDVDAAFRTLIKVSGGPGRHFARSARVGGVVAAAEQIARTSKAGASESDRVADLMLEQRAEIAKEFRLGVEEWRAAKKRGNDDAPLVAAFAQGPGALALAMMPEPSFQAWRLMSEAQRKELRDVVNDTVTPMPWVVEIPAGAVFFAAVVEAAENTPDALRLP